MSEVILPAPREPGALYHVVPYEKPFRVSGWVIMPGESATFRVTNENGYQRWERVLPAPPVEVKEDEQGT